MAEQKAAAEQPTAGWQTSGAGHPRRWAILGVLVTSLLVVVLDNTILNIALPTIQQDLGADQSQLLWAVDSYILVFAALLFTWGVLGDKYGRKKILIIGLTVFAIASAACAFATTPTMLIVFRGLMGIGGAAVLPVTLAVITVVFPPHERGKAIGAWAGAVGGAVALGPVLGGLLLENPQWTSWLTNNDWGGVFLINVPIVIVGLVGIVMVVPETKNPHPQALDIPGLIISFTGLVLFVYGIIHASQTLTFLTPSVLIPMILGALVLTLFVITEARSDHRSFDVTLFQNRGYAVSLSAVTLAFFAMNGILFTLPFFLQTLRGYSTLQAGLSFLPFAIGQIIAAPRSAGMVNRFGYKRVMTLGLSLVGLALLVLAFSLHLDTPLWVILVVFFVFGFGMGNVMAPASTVMQNALPLARAGAGSAVQNTVRQVGGALGVAVLGTVLATQYAKSLQPALDALPPQFPSDAKDAMSNSVIATVQVLGQAAERGLPTSVVDATKATAFDAFLSASHVTTLISAGIVILAALVVWFLLPPITPPQKGEHAPGGRPVNHGDEPHHVGDAHTREEANAGAEQLEDAYAREAAEEYEAAKAARATETDGA
jgi:EmrB/QacA subfamily drug resistance transporter